MVRPAHVASSVDALLLGVIAGDKVSLYGGLNATQAVQLVPDDYSKKPTKVESEGTSIESAGKFAHGTKLKCLCPFANFGA